MLKRDAVFVAVYEKHIASMGLELKGRHEKENIVKIEKDLRCGCLNVYYKQNDWQEWYRYFPDGTWG